ncbi:MAG: zinc ribbon domain-containing protein [Bryobacteraceae bacterium]|nr:zinc ribbon domain-containing protein [Bryobacteraceae bacterium]
MPIFEYACESCGNQFEKLVRRADDAVECPSCQSDKLAQRYSTFAARANGVARDVAPMGGCGGGLCQSPGMCGRN